MKRPVWNRRFLPTHSHGLRDGVLFWLLSDRLGADAWVQALGCTIFVIFWLGEMSLIGEEDQVIRFGAPHENSDRRK